MSDLDNILELYEKFGGFLTYPLLTISALLIAVSLVRLFRSESRLQTAGYALMTASAFMLAAGYGLVVWFHLEIYRHVALELPESLINGLNQWLEMANSRSAYALPLYEPSSPPRYFLPFWLENEKYLFWFLSYAIMAITAWRRLNHKGFRVLLQILLAVQTAVLALYCNPFDNPLPRFLEEIAPWSDAGVAPMGRVGLFMRLYPRLIFFYNAHYMWFHPPLLFLSYAALTVFFAATVVMLWKKDLACEQLGYSYAKFAYILLTVGMLTGYPWALKAWGPNWWWDPKIASSIMMWVVFSTYLHARLYLSRKGMWNFAGFLGIMSFAAMLFTFLASFFFPGEHTIH